jgi:tetratricopeptide (TPR) repeat protein
MGQLFPTTILEQIGVGSMLRELIIELRSPLSQLADPIFFGTYAAALALSFGCLLLPVRAPALRIVVWAGFVGFSFLAARNVALLGPVAGWVIAQQLGDWSRAAAGSQRRLGQLATAVALLGALALSAGSLTDRLWRGRGWHQRFGTGVREALFPIEAMAFVEQYGLPRPVLSDFAAGSYLIFEGGADSVFIDGRLEVYGAEAILENARSWAKAPGMLADADRHGIDSVLVAYPQMKLALDVFEASADWAPVYYDSARVLYLRRTPATRPLLAELELDWEAEARPRAGVPAALAPRDWAEGWAPRVADSSEAFDRALLLLHVGATSAGQRALREVVQIEPGHPEARLNLGLLAELAGDLDAARDHFSHVAVVRRDALDVHQLRLRLAGSRGDDAQRFEAAIGALAAGSRELPVLATLVELAGEPQRVERASDALRAALERGDARDRPPLRAALREIARRSSAGDTPPVAK